MGKRNYEVWCYLTMTLDNTSLMLLRHDCLGNDAMVDMHKACRILKKVGFKEKVLIIVTTFQYQRKHHSIKVIKNDVINTEKIKIARFFVLYVETQDM